MFLPSTNARMEKKIEGSILWLVDIKYLVSTFLRDHAPVDLQALCVMMMMMTLHDNL